MAVWYRNLLALALAVLFKPCASAEKGSACKIIIFTVPTIDSMHGMVSILSFHTYLIKILFECALNNLPLFFHWIDALSYST